MRMSLHTQWGTITHRVTRITAAVLRPVNTRAEMKTPGLGRKLTEKK